MNPFICYYLWLAKGKAGLLFIDRKSNFNLAYKTLTLVNRLNPFCDKALSESVIKATISVYIVKPQTPKNIKKKPKSAYFLTFIIVNSLKLLWMFS